MYTYQTKPESKRDSEKESTTEGTAQLKDNRQKANELSAKESGTLQLMRSETGATHINNKYTPTLRGIVQRVPYGTGGGTDNDRAAITTQALGPGEQVQATGDFRGRARINQMTVNGVNQAGKLLKHYMVVKSGFNYQFPIKHVLQPATVHGQHHENLGNSYGVRAGAAEGFGGNHDLAHNVGYNNGIAASRDATLNQEYQEENHHHNGANLNVHRSVKYAGPGMAGTLSIMNTNANLAAGQQVNNRGPFANRGEAEMAGTVTINCADLINGVLGKDALEAEIGRRVELRRTLLFMAHYGRLRGEQMVASSIAAQGGIFAHLVGMVADDVLAERARRHAAALAAAAARARMMRNFAIFMVVIIALGLLAWYHNFMGMFGPSDISKGGPPSSGSGGDGNKEEL